MSVDARENLAVSSENALLVKVILDKAGLVDNPLAELGELAESAGACVVGMVVQRRRSVSSGHVRWQRQTRGNQAACRRL